MKYISLSRQVWVFLYKILKREASHNIQGYTRKTKSKRACSYRWDRMEGNGDIGNKNSLIESINGRGSVRNERIIALC